MIGIIDYGMGNLRSVQKAFEHLGFKAFISNNKSELLKAEKIILPGVGAFGDAIATLKETGLDSVIYEAVDKNKPLLGICLGMQLLFDKSYENGEHNGLGILKGKVVKLPSKVKIPHIGWNSLEIEIKEPIFKGINNGDFVYFVHSYYLKTDEPIVSARVSYGDSIAVAAQNKNVFALQFHPEKSSRTGLRIIENFGRL